MYALAELFISGVFVVAFGTTLFLISLAAVSLGKGVVALAALLRQVASVVAITVASFVRAYRSGVRVWASGRRARRLALRPVPGLGIEAAPGE
jgi:hypothetical protein